MANQFIARKGLIALADSQITGSLNISQNIVAGGTVQATFDTSTATAISGAFDSVSSSLASEKLNNTTDTFNGDLTIGGNLIVNATPSKVTPDGNDFVVGGQLEAQGTAGSYIYSLALGSYSPTGTSGNLLVPGRIGVGTDSPGSKLDINGDINLLNSGNALRFNGLGAVYYSSTLDAVAVQQTQGTDWTRLHIGDITTGNAKLRLQTGTSSTAEEFGTSGWTDLLTVDTNGRLLVGKQATGYATEGVEIRPNEVLITNDGGTVLSLNRLTSDGTILSIAQDTTGIANINTSGNDIYFDLLQGGNVGIGATSPDEKLQVNGTIGSITSSYPTIKVQGSDVNYQGRMRWDTNNNYLEFLTRYGGTYYSTLVLDRNKVLIGTDEQAGNGQLTIGISDSDGGRLALTNLRDALFDGDSLGRIEFVSKDTTSTGVKAMIIARTRDVSANTDLQFHTGGGTLTEKMRILSSGGITFNGDTAAANALDDYEEGTWTPTYEGDSTAGTVTYGGRGGTYTKIGNQVTAYFSILNFSVSGAVGNIKISGLPYTALHAGSVRGAFSGNVRTYNMDWPSSTGHITLNLGDNNTHFTILQSVDNGTWNLFQVKNGGNQYIEGYITYQV